MPIFTPVHTSVFAAALDWEAHLLHRDTLATGYRCLLRLSDHTPGHYLYRIDEGTPRPAWYPAFQTADVSGTIAWAGLTLNYKWFRFDSAGAWARWTCPAEATGSNRIQLYVYGTGTGNTFDVIKNLGQPGQQTVYSGEADTGDLEALREITLASPLAEGDTIAIVQTGGTPRIHSFFTFADNVALTSVDQPYTIDAAVQISAPGSSMEYAQDLNPGAGGKWTGGLSHQENATGNCTEINLVSTWLRDGAPWTPEAGWQDGEFRRNVTADIDYDLTPTVIAKTDYTYTLGKRLLEFSHTLEAATALTVITNYVAMFPCDPAWPSAARSNTGEIIDLLGTGNPVEFDDPIGINRVTISTTPAGRHVQFDLQSNSGQIDNVFFSRLVDNKKCYYRQALEIVTATEQWHGGWSLAFTDGTPAPEQEAIVRGKLMPVDVGRKTWVQDRTSGQDWVWQGDGVARYIELEASPVRQFRERTIWLKVKTTSAGIEYFYTSASSQNANSQVAIGQDAAGNALFRAVAENAAQNEIVGRAINDGQWHQLIGQLNRNGHVWLWVDGIWEGSDGTNQLPETEFDMFNIGALVHQGADDYSAAAICQAGIVNRLSDGAEIAEIAAGRYPADALNFPIDNGPAMLTAALDIPASYWLDKSAQQNHAYGDNDARPMIHRDAFGNHYLAGDGSNDTLQTLRALVARTGGNLSVFVVYESRSASANLVEESTGITGAPGPQGFLLNTAVNTTRINGSTGYWSGTVPAAPVGAKAIREVHSSDGQQIVLDDGVQVGTPGAVAIGNMGGDLLNLFSRDGSANFLDGDIYRVYAYPVRLTAEEADAVRAWIEAQENMGPQPPQLSNIEATPIEHTSGSVHVTAQLTVLSNDPVTGAIVRVASGYQVGEDSLAFFDTASITGSWDAGSGVLTLTGSDTAAAYEAALRSVRFIVDGASGTSGARSVSFQTSNANGSSNVASRVINVAWQAKDWQPSDEVSATEEWQSAAGVTTIPPQEFLGSLDFYGAAADLTDALDLGTADFSVEFWFKELTRSSGTNRHIINFGATSSSVAGIGFLINNGNLTGAISSGSNWALPSLGSLAAGVWHHCLVSYERGGNALMRINGVAQTPASIAAVTGAIVCSYKRIGGDPTTTDGGNQPACSLSSLRVFPGMGPADADASVDWLYNGGQGRLDSEIDALGAGDPIYDYGPGGTGISFQMNDGDIEFGQTINESWQGNHATAVANNMVRSGDLLATSGWINRNFATFSVAAGVMNCQDSSVADDPSIYQRLFLKAGNEYRIKYGHTVRDGTASVVLTANTFPTSASQGYDSGEFSGSDSVDQTFTLLQDSPYWHSRGRSVGATCDFDITAPAYVEATKLFSGDSPAEQFQVNAVDGELVSEWIDQVSGSVLAEAVSGPVYFSNYFGSGLPGFTFNGTSQLLSGNIRQRTLRTLLLTFETGDVVDGTQVIWCRGTAGVNNAYDLVRIVNRQFEIVHNDGGGETVLRLLLAVGKQTKYTLAVISDGVNVWAVNGNVRVLDPTPADWWLPIGATDYVTLGAQKSDVGGSPVVANHFKGAFQGIGQFTEDVFAENPDRRILGASKPLRNYWCKGWQFEELIDLSDAADTNVVSASPTVPEYPSDGTAAVQAILDAHVGVSDLTFELPAGNTYLFGTLTWNGTRKLKIKATGATAYLLPGVRTMFDVQGADALVMEGGKYDGQYAQQTEGPGRLVSFIAGSAGNSNLCLLDGVTIQNTIGGASYFTTIGANNPGATYLGVRNSRFDNICNPANRFNLLEPNNMQCVGAYSNYPMVVVDDCVFDESSCVEAGKTVQVGAHIPSDNDQIGHARVMNSQWTQSGTVFFAQKAREALIENCTATDHGIYGGVNQSVNVIKVDDGAQLGETDSRIYVVDLTVRTDPSHTLPGIKYAESSGHTLNFVCENVDSNRSYAREGGFRGGLIFVDCKAGYNSNFGGPDFPSKVRNFQASAGVHAVFGTNTQVIGGSFGHLSFDVTCVDCVVDGINFTNRVTFGNGAVGCELINSTGIDVAQVVMQGDDSKVDNCDVRTATWQYAVDQTKAGATGIVITNNILQANAGGGDSAIQTNGPVGAIISGNAPPP